MAEPDPAPNYDTMSEAELDALFAKGEGFVNKEEEPKPAEPKEEAPPPETPPSEEPPVPESPAEPEASPEPPAEPEVDAAALEIEGERIKRERIEAALALQQAHSSRLAGEIGYLKEQLKSVPRERSEAYEPQTPEEEDRLTRLEHAFLELDRRRTQLEVAQAVESTINALDVPELSSIRAELAEAAAKYKEQFASIKEVSDPDLARQLAEAIGRSAIADARELAWASRMKPLEEKRTVQQAALTARKKAAAVSGGGAVSAPRPGPKKYEDMTPEELDAEMDKEFGRR